MCTFSCLYTIRANSIHTNTRIHIRYTMNEWTCVFFSSQHKKVHLCAASVSRRKCISNAALYYYSLGRFAFQTFAESIYREEQERIAILLRRLKSICAREAAMSVNRPFRVIAPYQSFRTQSTRTYLDVYTHTWNEYQYHSMIENCGWK